MPVFRVSDHQVVPTDDAVFSKATPAALVTIWDDVQRVQGLMPAEVVTPERYARLNRLAGALNKVADGGNVPAAKAEIETVEVEILESQRAVRKHMAKADWKEICWTLGAGIFCLAIYCLLRSNGFIDVPDGDTAYRRNLLQNSLGATGYAMLGFAVGLVLRRLYQMKNLPFSSLLERFRQGRRPILGAVGNLALVLAVCLSVLIGVEIVDTGNFGWPNIERPQSAIVPGLLIGLAGQKLLKLLFD